VSGSINRVIVVGNLTRDPELKAMPSGNSVCSMRIAVNDRVKDAGTGEWSERANYFDVDVFGAQGERCSQWLGRGRQVAVEGRLRWREWQAPDGQKRSAVSIVADNVQFVGPREGGAGEARQTRGEDRAGAASWGFPAEQTDDDDIPF
jgi:single-strand DNA-binding protein